MIDMNSGIMRLQKLIDNINKDYLIRLTFQTALPTSYLFVGEVVILSSIGYRLLKQTPVGETHLIGFHNYLENNLIGIKLNLIV